MSAPSAIRWSLLFAGMLCWAAPAPGAASDDTSASGSPEVAPPARDPGPTASATSRPAWMWFEDAWRLKKEGDDLGAIEAFEEALAAGGDAQSIHLELGWLRKKREEWPEARAHFREVLDGDDLERRRIAVSELRSIPKVLWGDLYVEGYGWHRLLHQESSNFVPTARVRGFLHPIPKVDLDPYIFLQISRDVASRSSGPQGYPLVYADNHVMVGGGVQFRFWKKQVGLFAQIGPAFNLLEDGTAPVKLDVRAGAWLGLSTPTCFPLVPEQPPYVRLDLRGCAETYDELVYVSRFSHDLLLSLRGRLSFTYLVTGPVAWQPVLEGRLLKDIRNDYWSNLVDAGVGHRWRLLWPFGLDLMLGLHVGTYMGLASVDPVPDPAQYLELRLQAATYVAF